MRESGFQLSLFSFDGLKMGWSIGDLFIAFVTVVGLPVTLLLGGVFFGVGYLWLYLNNLVGAVIWFIIGLLVVAALRITRLFTAENIHNQPKLLLVLLVPFVSSFLFGWLPDNTSFLSFLSVAPMVSGDSGFMYHASLDADALSIVVTAQALGLIMFLAGVALTALMMLKFKVSVKRKR